MLKINSFLLALCFALSLPAVKCFAQSAPRQMTLADCIERALANHPLLKAAQTRVQGAEEFSRFVGVRPNPTVTVQTENWRAWQQPPFSFGRDIDIFVYGTQRLETAGKAVRRRELAERQTGVAQSEIDVIRRQLRTDITRNYWAALHAQTLLEILAENRGDLDQLVTYTGTRVREGFAAESELIRVRLEQQTLIGQEAAATLAMERAKLELLKAMGETNFELGFRLVAPDGTASPLLAANLDQLRTEALQKRPELVRLRARVEAERANLNLQQANAKPDWEVSAGYKRTGGYNTYITYVTVPLPFFNKNRAEIGRATAFISSAEQELLAEENYIRAEIETAHRAVLKLSERLTEMQRDFLKQADRSRDIALIAYREGAADLYKLLETQRARNEARLLYARTQQELLASIAELALTVGGELK
ncbi:MAG TPA: TolC family protein [Blastocatellia bacterium]|nr:TolC family protein [Blastocatellia bacterium]HMX25885.1 TolC family protein [Blastocatellia bacterium]HNG31729.1 TolC family protein [Blastocatellia bacterium]